MKDDVYSGYRIPESSMIIGNIWYILLLIRFFVLTKRTISLKGNVTQFRYVS